MWVLATFMAAAAGWVWFLTGEGRSNADQWSSIAAFALAAVSAVAAVLARLPNNSVPALEVDDLIADEMARLVQFQSEQWKVELAARQVDDPYPLPVRWRVSARAKAVMANWASVTGRPSSRPVPVAGSFHQIAAIFTGHHSPRRLVVLGEPGSGKSILVLQLALDLLAIARQHLGHDQDPAMAEQLKVPILMPINGWDPQQPLIEWIAARLAADHQGLRRLVTGPDGRPRSLAAELIARGKIVPILDGLDEITDTRRPAALAGVQAMTAQLTQFVLTCRTRPYEEAVKLHGPLPRTPVVEIQPLRIRQASRYLTDGADDGPFRWAAVVQHLHREPDSPLAAVLTTPLYAWLARILYRHHTTNPAELLSLNDAGDSATSAGDAGHIRTYIQQHLLHQLIPTVFTSATGGRPARTPEQAAAAHRCLAHLAGCLKRQDTYDLTWWKLDKALPQWQLRIGIGIEAGVAIAIAITILSGPEIGAADIGFGLWVGTMVGGLLGIMVEPTSVSHPRRTVLSPRRVVRKVVGGLVRGSAYGFVAGLVLGIFMFGILVAVEGDLGDAFDIGLKYGLLPGLTMGLLFGIAAGAGAGVADGLTDTTEEQHAVSPGTVLHDDRTVTLVIGLEVGLGAGLVCGLAFGVAAGVTTEFEDGLTPAIFIGLAFGLGFGLLVSAGNALTSAWGRFLVVRGLLALQGHAPLRLMTFLQEAHERGVLRQAGGIYQFRHADLQEHLAVASDAIGISS